MSSARSRPRCASCFRSSLATGWNRTGLRTRSASWASDVASVRAFTSADGLNYGRLAYQGQAGLLRLGGAYTYMDYKLGKEFAVLDAKGTAKIRAARWR